MLHTVASTTLTIQDDGQGEAEDGLHGGGFFCRRFSPAICFRAGHYAYFYPLLLSAGIAVGGTLRVDRVRGSVPKAGDSFKMISSGPITGPGFGAQDLPPWFGWSVHIFASRPY
ncbi:MAG: hypothetical protein A2X46_13210 [Lentisphaerae bacterium GWF2_57_35]|nr:MAG: hypothetical protein A2X46_13210 [Lentisphaerae bacterium GWF2_57_35]